MRYAISHRSRVFLAAALVLTACAAGKDAATSTTTPVSAPSTTESTTVPPTTSTPADATEIVVNMAGPLQPGDYWIDHDRDPATRLRVNFTISKPGWEPIIGTYKEAAENNYVNVLFAAVTKIASAACHDTEWLPAGDTAEEIAAHLADIDEFITREPLTEVTAYGYDGYHLVLEIPDGDYYQPGQGFTGCDDPNNQGGHSFDGWEGPTFSRYYQRPGQIIESWVLDVDGIPLLIETSQFPDSPQNDIAELQDVLDSIAITP
jgi:hypothetical protein